MSGKISFVGAGPGAVDLITLRGVDLLVEADVVIYAASMINESILELAKNAKFFNIFQLSFYEILSLMVKHYYDNKNVVSLYVGDPSMYGEVSEYYHELNQYSIPYEVVPGVSSVFAAAAALKKELTVAGASQTVILTRGEGHASMPENENLENLAALGTTLCVFLSVAELPKLCTKLLQAGRPPQTPAAVVYRASWDNEMIVNGVIDNISERVIAAGIKRQAMIIIGEVLQRRGNLLQSLSGTDSTSFYHGLCRKNSFVGKIAIFGLGRMSLLKGAEIAGGLENATIFASERFADTVPLIRSCIFPDGKFLETFYKEWKNYDGFIMIMPAEVVIRHIAKLCKNKLVDPAIVVCDEVGNFAVSLLSNTKGSGNILARDVARITGGKPVITTATDLDIKPCVDKFIKKHHYEILNPEARKSILAAFMDGAHFDLEMPVELFTKEFSMCEQFTLRQNRQDKKMVIHSGGTILYLQKLKLAIGVECDENISEQHLCDILEKILTKYGFDLSEIACMASSETKRKNEGFLLYAAMRKLPLFLYSSEDLNNAKGVNLKGIADKQCNNYSVSEAAALLAVGDNARLLLDKYSEEDVTISIAGGLE